MNQFLDIPGYEGIYQIDRSGIIKSLSRWVHQKHGKPYLISNRILKVCKNTQGYLMVRLSKNGSDRLELISRLLALTFIPNPNNYPLVRHLNDINTDNRLENLRWGTPIDNAQDCIKNGNWPTKKGEKHHWFGILRKTILDHETGIFYDGTEEAAKAKGINVNTLMTKLSGHRKNNTMLKYV